MPARKPPKDPSALEMTILNIIGMGFLLGMGFYLYEVSKLQEQVQRADTFMSEYQPPRKPN